MRAAQDLLLRAALVGPALGRQLLQGYAGPRAAAARRTLDRPDSPPRERLDGVGDRAWRDSRASSGLLEPSAGCDGPVQTVIRSPGSDSRGLGSAALAVAPVGSSGCARQLPPHAHRARAASPHGWHRTPDAETFPRKRALRPRAPTGPVRPRPPAPERRHGRRPDIARPARRDRCRGAGPSRRAVQGHRLVAAPWWAFPRKRSAASRRRPLCGCADTTSRAPRQSLREYRANLRLPRNRTRDP